MEPMSGVIRHRPRGREIETSHLLLLAMVLTMPLRSAANFYAPGQTVPIARRIQHNHMRTGWEDIMARQCPRYGHTKLVLLTLQEPNDFKGVASSYKMALEIGKERLQTQWLPILSEMKRETVPIVVLNLFHANGQLRRVYASVAQLNFDVLKENGHQKIGEEFLNETHWPKQLFVRYQWHDDIQVDASTGLTFLLGAAATMSLVMGLHIGLSSKEKLRKFLNDTIVESKLVSVGDMAKVE
eukprot:TRINITY_DN936_c0_g1_i2.p1 TRINITY_DN936_c0_g1~~TRINITY_DN936_c0_g1_i2.p1  ORF type:complete len:241 (+),score=23.25 TRINITY_DN936_c0_g1_i2:134-856(+)